MKLFLLILLSLCLAASSALAGDRHDHHHHDHVDTSGVDDEVRAVKAWLSLHHRIPTRKELEALSPNARQIVLDVAGDEETFLFHRHRALHALVHWPDDEVFTFLVGLLHDPSTEEGMRHHLLPTLGEGFGDRAVPVLEPILLNDEDPQIRISAAAALAEVDSDAAIAVLRHALETEQHSVVRYRLEQFAIQLR